MSILLPDPSRSATLSPCGTYRYSLTRRWAASGPIDCWICLNPSTADAERNDPSLTKMCGFSRRWGAAGLVLVNAFALRATNPADMLAAANPVGPDNDAAILEAVKGARHVILGWGCHGKHRRRDAAVLDLLAGVVPKALLVNKDGTPGHPLYISGNATPKPFGGAK
nr:DUF1643 domain-containing protein [uncultured Rhodopila sp.]